MICVSSRDQILEDIKRMEDVSRYDFSSTFNLFGNTNPSRIFSYDFPKVTDVKSTQLERELTRASRFVFSGGLVGFFELGLGCGENLTFFDSKNYDLFSKAFVRESFYRRNKRYLDSEGMLTGDLEFTGPEGVLPSMYFLESENGLGRIFLRNYIRERDSMNRRYEQGMNIRIGVSPKEGGEEILGLLKRRIISLYGERHARVDLNN